MCGDCGEDVEDTQFSIETCPGSRSDTSRVLTAVATATVVMRAATPFDMFPLVYVVHGLLLIRHQLPYYPIPGRR